MKQVYCSPDVTMVHLARNILGDHGIKCMVQGENLANAVGEIPLSAGYVELFVTNDEQFEEAKGILKEHLQEESGPEDNETTKPLSFRSFGKAQYFGSMGTEFANFLQSEFGDLPVILTTEDIPKIEVWRAYREREVGTIISAIQQHETVQVGRFEV